jgi:hypothetical protein
MALWGNVDSANNSPKYKGVLAGPKNYVKSYSHVKTEKTIVIPSGAGYNNTDILVVSVSTPDTTYGNATYTLTTNATGYIQSLDTINHGSFSLNPSNTQYAITNTTYGTATGNSTTTGFSGATFSQRVAGMQLYANTVEGAFQNNVIEGIYGVSTDEIQTIITNTGSSPGLTPGWILEKRGTGPVTGLTVTAGAGFSNGDTLTISNGSANGTATLTTNATGNLVSATINYGGAGFFTNTHVVTGFNREKHAANINYTGTATGYSNTDYVVVSNSIINATANVSTNATGGSLAFTFSNTGIFANTTSNTQVVVKIYAANGVANGTGSGATFTSANLVASTGGSINITTTGGRSNRKQYEILAAVHKLANNTNSGVGGGSTLA